MKLVSGPEALAGPAVTAHESRRRPLQAGRSQLRRVQLLQALLLAAGWVPAAAMPSERDPLRHGQAALLRLQGTDAGQRAVQEPADDKDGSDIYRPWATRFRPTTYDFSGNLPEWRVGYRRFMVANPHHALVPNGDDREAQSNVVLYFGLATLSTVICLVIAIEHFQVLTANDVDFAAYEMRFLKAFAVAAIPWVLLQGWLFRIFLTSFASPCRENVGIANDYHWQCSAILWYIITTPIVNLAYFFVQTIWASHVFFGVEKQAQMGRMLNRPTLVSIPRDGGILGTMASKFIQPSVRHAVFSLEVMNTCMGIWFVSFRSGANSHYCKPEIYWITLANCLCNCIVVLFTALAFFCSLCVKNISNDPWAKDFSDSFHSSSRAVMRREQKAVAQQMAEAAARKAQAASDYAEDREFPDEDARTKFLREHFQQQDALHKEARAAWVEAVHAEKPIAAVPQPSESQARPRPQDLLKKAATTIIAAHRIQTAPQQAEQRARQAVFKVPSSASKPAKVLGYGMPSTQSTDTSAGLPSFPPAALAPPPTDPLLWGQQAAAGSSDNWRSAQSNQAWQSTTSQAFGGVLDGYANRARVLGNPQNTVWSSSTNPASPAMAVTEPAQFSPPMTEGIPRNLPWKSEGFAAPFGQAPASGTSPSTVLQAKTFLDARPLPAQPIPTAAEPRDAFKEYLQSPSLIRPGASL
mmetsp:Transcript_132304/g.254778  ORF Transcript_132304/g.254778 Transcript_132304/m.254778 type:complete len:695 (-) Transcript_132304:116-2200(-)